MPDHIYNGWPHGDESVCSCGWNPTPEERDQPLATRTVWKKHVEGTDG